MFFDCFLAGVWCKRMMSRLLHTLVVCKKQKEEKRDFRWLVDCITYTFFSSFF